MNHCSLVHLKAGLFTIKHGDYKSNLAGVLVLNVDQYF